MFIEVTKMNKDEKQLVNIRHIVDVEKSGVSGTSINLNADGSYRIVAEESYEEVKALIEHEVQAERGY